MTMYRKSGSRGLVICLSGLSGSRPTRVLTVRPSRVWPAGSLVAVMALALTCPACKTNARFLGSQSGQSTVTTLATGQASEAAMRAEQEKRYGVQRAAPIVPPETKWAHIQAAYRVSRPAPTDAALWDTPRPNELAARRKKISKHELGLA